MQDMAMIANDYGSHKGCRYMIHGHVFVAAALVAAINDETNTCEFLPSVI